MSFVAKFSTDRLSFVRSFHKIKKFHEGDIKFIYLYQGREKRH